MSKQSGTLAKPTLVGRSSSHFTRVARIFAAEMRVDCRFEVVPDLMATDAAAYGGNPALKLPILHDARGTWFGSLSISRQLVRQSGAPLRVAWPEDLDQPLAANAQELIAQAMATEVTLIMAGLAGAAADDGYQAKLRNGLRNTLAWLEDNAAQAIAALPGERDLSYLEVTLFCLLTHLEFRDVLPLGPCPRLRGFRDRFEARASAATTAYRFDG
ncbi:hypothetical protein [Luteimonas sp. R10]|uniref:hypothetical protein n=1 Tax=Luteimonas sp. R10 TaxID=3108176 RepID=UPI00308664D6|nr:hypothetical protein U3649_03115 [Luteimonas sp. R10]